ncbi:MAG: DNA repair protein RecO [Anaerosomatales bacterium]|nr:DNA repair protein RecO [Anaerosomatales bacterium]
MSRSYAARALVLRKTKLGESDLIVTALSSEGHQIRAVAKGARKPGSRFGARVEPFTVIDGLFARGRTLDVLTEAQTVAAHDRLRTDYEAVRSAAVVADLLERVTAESDAEPRLYELGIAVLDAIEDADPVALPTLVAAFLVKAMAMQGLRPQLAGCVSCGGACAPAAAFSISGGGTVCAACVGTDPSAIAVSAELPGALAWLLRSRLVEVAAEPLTDCLAREALVVLRAFASHHVPARLRAFDAYLRG